jgi:hypothetical protein
VVGSDMFNGDGGMRIREIRGGRVTGLVDSLGIRVFCEVCH